MQKKNQQGDFCEQSWKAPYTLHPYTPPYIDTSKNYQICENTCIFPDFEYCTDNAAMISYLGEKKFQMGKKTNLDFSINPNFKNNLDWKYKLILIMI